MCHKTKQLFFSVYFFAAFAPAAILVFQVLEPFSFFPFFFARNSAVLPHIFFGCCPLCFAANAARLRLNALHCRWQSWERGRGRVIRLGACLKQMTKMTHDHTGVSKKIYRPKDLIQTGRRKKCNCEYCSVMKLLGNKKQKLHQYFLEIPFKQNFIII